MGRTGNREPAGTKWVFLGVRGSGDGVGGTARGVGQGWAAQTGCVGKHWSLQSHVGIRSYSLSNKSLSHRILNIPLK